MKNGKFSDLHIPRKSRYPMSISNEATLVYTQWDSFASINHTHESVV